MLFRSGERVEDIFFLADSAGGQLQDDALLATLESDLLTALDTGQQEESPASGLNI